MRWCCIILASLYLRAVSGSRLTTPPMDTGGGVVVERGQRRLVLLAQQNFLVGIASLGALRETNSTRCGQELEMLLQATADRQVWALKVSDNFGTPPKSFTWGNYFWFGTPGLCEDLNHPYAISLAHSQPVIFNATSPFPLHFVVVYMNFTSPYTIDLRLPFESYIDLGLCLPKSCSSIKIRSFADLYFQKRLFGTQQQFDLEMRAIGVKTPYFSPLQYFTQTGSVVFLVILFSSLALPILAEVVHKSKHKLELQHSMCRKGGKLGGELRSYQPQTRCAAEYNKEQVKSSMWEQLLMCFHLSANYVTVTSLENSNRNSVFLTSMAGLRTIICMWITVFHVYYYSLFAMSNTPVIFAKLEKFALQPIMQACFYVDVFFIMSSFLLVFNFLSNVKQMERIAAANWWETVKLFLNSLLQRYMRLTPVMIITILLSTMSFDLLNMYSPFRLGEPSGLYCKTNWWYNLFYIHNLLDMDRICCSWTWYLACEMQYFVLFSAMLFLHAKHPKAAKTIFIALALGLIVIGWISNYANGITFEIDVIYSTLNRLYVKPWVRIPPYVGGATMGWLMQRRQKDAADEQRQQQQSQVPNPRHDICGRMDHPIFWLLCFFLYVATNFMSYWRSTPSWAVATIMSVGKLIFALCVGGVIIQCSRGRGGVLNTFLSARPFLFLNKFCYSIYMLAPVIVALMFGLRNEPTNFTEIGSGADFFAITTLAMMSAMVLFILVELPMQRISNVLMKQKRS